MSYCTRCGRKLPASGECPYCTNRYYGRRSQPMVHAVLNACSSYVTLVLDCIWTITLLSLLVFSALTLNPLLLIAVPGVLVVIGLWMVYGGEGHTQRLGLTLISGALQVISLLAALVLIYLCIVCFVSIFLCTTDQNYDTLSTPLLFLSVGLLVALPVSLVFLHKVRRVITTSRSVLLRSRTTVEVSIFAIAVFMLGAVGLIFAALHLSEADTFLSSLRTMVGSVIPDPYYTIFSWMIGISWSGMTLPFILASIAFAYTSAALIRYRVRLYKTKEKMISDAAAAKARKKAASGDAEIQSESGEAKAGSESEQDSPHMQTATEAEPNPQNQETESGSQDRETETESDSPNKNAESGSGSMHMDSEPETVSQVEEAESNSQISKAEAESGSLDQKAESESESQHTDSRQQSKSQDAEDESAE